MPSTAESEPEVERETLHELMNALAAARMWLVVLGNAPAKERQAVLADTLPKLNRTVGDAEECCHRLREVLSGPPARRRRRK